MKLWVPPYDGCTAHTAALLVRPEKEDCKKEYVNEFLEKTTRNNEEKYIYTQKALGHLLPIYNKDS